MLKFKIVNILFFLIFIAAVIMIADDKLPLLAVLWVFGAWLLLTFLGSTNIRWNYFFTSLFKNKSVDEKVVALTFDDGPSENTLKILDLLKKYKVKATFFCIGHKIDEHPKIFRRILEEGHQVGNHTYSHSPIIGFFSTKRMEREIEQCNLAAQSHGGVEMRLFRPPGGVTNPKIKRALQTTGHESIGWSVRSFDAMFQSEKIIYKLVTRNIKPGDIILMHDTKSHSVSILEQLLLFLQKRNFKTITVGSLFKINVYR